MVLDFLAFDNFNFTRKIVKIVLVKNSCENVGVLSNLTNKKKRHQKKIEMFYSLSPSGLGHSTLDKESFHFE